MIGYAWPGSRSPMHPSIAIITSFIIANPSSIHHSLKRKIHSSLTLHFYFSLFFFFFFNFLFFPSKCSHHQSPPSPTSNVPSLTTPSETRLHTKPPFPPPSHQIFSHAKKRTTTGGHRKPTCFNTSPLILGRRTTLWHLESEMTPVRPVVDAGGPPLSAFLPFFSLLDLLFLKVGFGLGLVL